jgi:CelD/BcsL family acetyltransferase involved in cellulose biosynthesis
LNHRSFGDHPLLTASFVEGLLRHFGSGREHLAIYRDADGVALAMCLLQAQSRLIWTSFQPSQAQLGPTMITEHGLLDSLARALPWPALQLDLMCNDPAVGPLVRDAAPHSLRLNHALTMDIRLDGGFEPYWLARSKKLRSNIQRYGQRASAEGLPPQLRCYTATSEMPSAVNRYAELEGRGWKAKLGTALGSVPEQLAFFQELLAREAAAGRAMVFELWLGEQLAASRLLIERAGTFVALKTGYDESLSKYAPGRLLLKGVIESLFASHPGHRIEFYTDATQDQLAWATGQRWIQHLSLYRSSLAAGLLNCARILIKGPLRAHDSKLQVQTVTRLDDLPADAQQWLQQAEAGNFELGLTWFRNLTSTVYANDPGVRFVLLREGEQLRALFPLLLQRRGTGPQVSSLANFYTALYEPLMDPLLKPDDLLPVLLLLKQEVPKLNRFWLAPMAPESHAYQTLLQAFRLARWWPFEFFAFGNWFTRTPAGGWTDYQATRQGDLRGILKRKGLRFAREGGRLEIVKTPEALAPVLDKFLTVYAARWKRNEPFPDFLPGLMQSCAQRGSLRLGLAWLGDRVVAAQIWIVSDGRAEIYKLAYDERFGDFSPGSLLTAKLMQEAMEQDGVAEVDYLIGDDAYKESWMDARRQRWGILAFDPFTLAGACLLAIECTVRGAKCLLPGRAPTTLAEKDPV